MNNKFMHIFETGKAPKPVDCGNCPVNIACAVGGGGTGWTFDCCHSTSVEQNNDGRRRLLVIDCGKHAFEQIDMAKECKLCPLCSGDIVDVELRDEIDTHRYVPTVYAKVPLAVRVKKWQETLPLALERMKKV